MARAPQQARPAPLESPAVRRSKYLAEALQTMNARQPDIRSGGQLAAELLAQGITQFSKNRADKAVDTENTARLDTQRAALAAALGGAPATPSPMGVAVSPAPPTQPMPVPDPMAGPVAPPAAPMAAPEPMQAQAPQQPAQPQIPGPLRQQIELLSAQGNIDAATELFGQWQQQQAMMASLPEAIRNDPIQAWAAINAPKEVGESYGYRARPQVVAEGGRQVTGGAGGGEVYNPRTFVGGGEILQTQANGGVDAVRDLAPTSADVTAQGRLALDRQSAGFTLSPGQVRSDLQGNTIASVAPPPRAPNPKDDEDRNAILGFQANNDRFRSLITNIAGDPERGIVPQFDLSPAAALGYKAALATGIGMSPEAAAYGDYVSEIKSAVSDALRLNVGPQTDQDAIREAQALLSNVDNKDYVLRRLPTVIANNERLAAARQASMSQRAAATPGGQAGAVPPLPTGFVLD